MSKFVATSSRNNSAPNGAVIDILQQIYSNVKTAKACIENIRPNGENKRGGQLVLVVECVRVSGCLENNQRIKAQRIKTRGMRWTAFSPEDLCGRGVSFLAASETSSCTGKSSVSRDFRDGEPFSEGEPFPGGNRFARNSSENRGVLAVLYIF